MSLQKNSSGTLFLHWEVITSKYVGGGIFNVAVNLLCIDVEGENDER